jgi:hypothetical protein
MKHNVGDLLLVKKCEYKPRPSLLLRLRPLPRLMYYPELCNSFGIVTEAIKHSDAWKGETTSDDNIYIWFSQIDGKEYYFCEYEVTGDASYET